MFPGMCLRHTRYVRAVGSSHALSSGRSLAKACRGPTASIAVITAATVRTLMMRLKESLLSLKGEEHRAPPRPSHATWAAYSPIRNGAPLHEVFVTRLFGLGSHVEQGDFREYSFHALGCISLFRHLDQS